MQKIVLMSIVGLFALALGAPLGSAHDLGCNGVIHVLVGDGSAGSNSVYLDDRTASAADPFDIWVYLETNGEDHVQTGGFDPTTQIGDPCTHGTNVDTLLL